MQASPHIQAGLLFALSPCGPPVDVIPIDKEIRLNLSLKPGTRWPHMVEVMVETTLAESIMDIDGEVLGADVLGTAEERSEDGRSLVVMGHFAGFDKQGEPVRLERPFDVIAATWHEEITYYTERVE